MTSHNRKTSCQKHGKDRRRIQRYKCQQCSNILLPPRNDALHGMYLTVEKAEFVLRLLLEGNSVSSVVRATGVHQKTILKLLVLTGEKCERIMPERVRNVVCRDIEWDEVWSLVGEKQKRVRPEDDPSLGDCYVFAAIERHSKLVLNIAIGKRDQQTTDARLEGVRHSTSPVSRFQITTDGFAPYRTSIPVTLNDRNHRLRDAHQGLPQFVRRRRAVLARRSRFRGGSPS